MTKKYLKKMNLGIIIGYFYGKGLILCSNNKLRYFDILDGLKEEFDQKYFCGCDKKIMLTSVVTLMMIV